MSKASAKGEHGTTISYVIGFILSLIFTAIPYYMVVNHTLSGRALLATILGFGVLQMLVQIFFFLHLGRGPKPLYNVAFFVSTVGIILVVVFGSIFIIDHLHYHMVPGEVTKKVAQDEAIAQLGGEETGACKEVHQNYQVVITASGIVPGRVEAQLCDTLTFISQDERQIHFGTYPELGSYAGETELSVRDGRNKTINLNQTGNYQFYDQKNPQLTGSFTVE